MCAPVRALVKMSPMMAVLPCPNRARIVPGSCSSEPQLPYGSVTPTIRGPGYAPTTIRLPPDYDPRCPALRRVALREPYAGVTRAPWASHGSSR